MITVNQTGQSDPLEFDVSVSGGGSETRHQVTMSSRDCERLAAERCSPEQCIEAAFLFLLDREPKEAILSRFDVTIIARYFPEFEAELPGYVAKVQSGDRAQHRVENGAVTCLWTGSTALGSVGGE
ncbi:MAG TPA: hypothetical protein VMN38_06800 [Sphingomicrobium sp.]|nr:hypothetical protein [Sphingomicrobium sp.]